MGQVVMVFLTVSVAAGYFIISALVAPRIKVPSADPRVVLVIRAAAVAFFVGCGMTHLHMLVHGLGYGAPQPIETHELGFHALQAMGSWLFIIGGLLRFEIHVMPSTSRAGFESAIAAQSGLLAEARTAATTDDLTGLTRRGGFDSELAAEMARVERYGRPGALMLIDVDGLKTINDADGHQAGDHALRGVADVMRQDRRTVDVAARIGGDEFAIILPEVTIEQAGEAARRLLSSMRAERGEEGPPVTLSIGVAAIDGLSATSDVVREADIALYSSKRGGGDRHTVASSTPSRTAR